MKATGLDDEEYRRLFERRNELRRFLRWSEQQAHEVGLTDAHHQLLIAIRAHPEPIGPTIGDVAQHLVLRHHSAVELVQRAEAANLVIRSEDPDDKRRVRLRLSEAGVDALARLAAVHEEELRVLSGDAQRFSGSFAAASNGDLAANAGAAGATMAPAAAAANDGPAEEVDRRRDQPEVAALRVCWVYDRPGPEVGRRVLVDRLWPRGIRADDAPFDEWLGAIAPSNALRRMQADEPERFDDFAVRYRDELADRHADVLDRLEAFAMTAPLTLITATTELAHSAAAVLAQDLASRIGRRLQG